MTKKMIWRLKEQPSTESLRDLVKDGILTKEEAREILFSSETEGERDKKSLESEIKFLRELVEKLSKSRSEVVTTIREIQFPYQKQTWYQPYWVWCGGDSIGLANYTYLTDATSTNLLTSTEVGFSGIKTF